MIVSTEKLYQAAQIILTNLGESSENAAKVADVLLKADKRGVSTHGTYLLKVMEVRVKKGQLRLPTTIQVVSDSDATAILDGGNGIGMLAGLKALDIGVEKAREYGIGIVLVRNTNNLGSLACYTMLAAEKGMIAIMSCNAAPAMAPWGGAEQFMGTNPIGISIPADGPGFTADMATSIVARGKIREVLRQGYEIPEGWALNKEGVPTTKPEEAITGSLLPFGGAKGSALALAVDIISGMLSGAAYGPEIKSFHTLDGPTGVGASLIVIDVGRFMLLENFMILMEDYTNAIKSLKKAEGYNEILMPGEREKRIEKASENGVSLDPVQLAALNKYLVQAGSKLQLGVE